MKLSDYEIDVKRQDEGAWIGEKYGTPIPEMGPLCLKTKGANNRAWRKLQTQLMNSLPRKKRIEGTDPEEQDRINAILLRDTALLDWDGIDDEDGKPVPFSKAQAFEYLMNPKNVRFRDGAMWAANVVADKRTEEIEEDAKN